MDIPIVFISSTSEDLKAHRQAAQNAVMKAGCHPEMMEYFAAGGNPPLPTCLEKVRPCDVLVVIVAHRYGWIPPDQPASGQKSITWLECEQAATDGKQILALLVDEKYTWPEAAKENYRLTEAMSAGTATPEFFQEVNAAVQQLKLFKQWLGQKYTTDKFTTPTSLGSAVLHALVEWQKKQGKASPTTTARVISSAYKDWLARRCATIELLAHLSQQGCAPPRLAAVYVPVPTTPAEGELKAKKPEPTEEEKLTFLLDRFQKESLYVAGLAGSGKSTFARWVAFLLCQEQLPETVQIETGDPIEEQFPVKLQDKLPLLIPFREFWPFLPHYAGQRELSRQEFETALEKWVTQKLEFLDGLTVIHFLKTGQALLLFDGVDEIPVSAGTDKNVYYPREMLINGLKQLVPAWLKQGNHLLVTSRPYGLAESDARLMELPRAEIIDLPDKLQRLFITRWFRALEYSPELAKEMWAHLQGREELAQLSGNPVMLMAMCILFPEGKRLPQDKAELYQKTIERMLFNRYGDANEAERVLHSLSVIAYGMHTGTGLGETRPTPRAETTTDEIDQMLTQYQEQSKMTERGFTTVTNTREELLSRSGLLLQKDRQSITFYHLSFQEYLAGRRLKELSGDQLFEKIQHYAHRPEWRATLGFAFGYACAGSPEKAMTILQYLLKTASVEQLAHLVLTADLVEIIYRKNYVLAANLEQAFKALCLTAIEKEVDLPERFDLGRVLELVGDPRIEPDLRRFPAGYLEIPAGTYPIGDENRPMKIKRSFWLSKYPVTNSQFRLFLEDGGYHEPDWWSPEGWQWREKKGITEPLLWRHGRWNGENQPVVGVSWYEAQAFCRWAGGDLPNEQEWKAAVWGNRENKYSWGDQWENDICNSREAKLGIISPVGLFPRSRCPESGLEDMIGNVWEWCQDWSDQDQDARVLRGGSFFSDEFVLSCVYRDWLNPDVRDGSVGFRVVRRSES